MIKRDVSLNIIIAIISCTLFIFIAYLSGSAANTGKYHLSLKVIYGILVFLHLGVIFFLRYKKYNPLQILTSVVLIIFGYLLIYKILI
jgi:hypothetical protein